MATNRRAGIVNLDINGVVYDVVGNADYNLGVPKRDPLVGSDRVHGDKELPQAPMLKCELRDKSDLDLRTAILELRDGTVTLGVANGKDVMFEGATYTGTGNVGTEEANIEFEIYSLSAEEI